MIKLYGHINNGRKEINELFYEWSEVHEYMEDNDYLFPDSLDIALIHDAEGYSRDVDEKYDITTDGVGNLELLERLQTLYHYRYKDHVYEAAVRDGLKVDIDINDEFPDFEEIFAVQDMMELVGDSEVLNLMLVRSQREFKDIFGEWEDWLNQEVTILGNDDVDLYKQLSYPILVKDVDHNTLDVLEIENYTTYQDVWNFLKKYQNTIKENMKKFKDA